MRKVKVIKTTHSVSSDRLRESYITQYPCGFVKSGVPLWVLFIHSFLFIMHRGQMRVGMRVVTGTAVVVALVTVAAIYPHSTLKGTLTCSDHSRMWMCILGV